MADDPKREAQSNPESAAEADAAAGNGDGEEKGTFYFFARFRRCAEPIASVTPLLPRGQRKTRSAAKSITRSAAMRFPLAHLGAAA